MNPPGLRISLLLALLGFGLAGQPAGAVVPAPAERYIVEPLVDGADAARDGEFSEAELDQLLAPIALYPDALLSQVLIAATYPLEIVSAARWSRDHPELEGEQAVAAVAERDWDPSVKALVAFPDLLARLDEDLDWTRNLGDAVLLQEQDVMDSIQFLRAQADANGSLETTEYARVIREEKTIIIEPTTTRIVHVPFYDPLVVYGGWWRPAYPPVVWAPPARFFHGHPGFFWSPGIRISSGFFFSSFYWPQRHVVIVRTPRYYHPSRFKHARPYYTPGKRWIHNPSHRRGVHYRHHTAQERFRDERFQDRTGGSRLERQLDRGKQPADTRRRPPDARRAEAPRTSDVNRVQSTSRFQAPQARPGTRTQATTRTPADRTQATNRTPANRSQATSRAPSSRDANSRTPSSRASSERTLSSREPSRRALSTRAPTVTRETISRTHATARVRSAQPAQSASRVQAAPRARSAQPAQSAPRVQAAPRARSAQSASSAPRAQPAPRARSAQSAPRTPSRGAQASGRSHRVTDSQQRR